MEGLDYSTMRPAVRRSWTLALREEIYGIFVMQAIRPVEKNDWAIDCDRDSLIRDSQ